MNRAFIADSGLLFVAFVWGITFVVVQNALSFLEPMTFNAVRFFTAGLLLTIWLLFSYRKQVKLVNKSMISAGVIMGFWLFGGYALQTFGLLYTTSSKAGFLTGLSVVLVPVFSLFILKQKPKPNALMGVSIATVGLYLLTMGDKLNLNQGDILVFFCAISFALQIVYTGKYSSLFPALILTVIQIFTVALLCTISALLFENWQPVFTLDVISEPKVFGALLVTALFATAIAFYIQTNFQRYTTPTRVALIFAMEPVFAALTGFFFANDRLSYNALVGCLLIFIGMILAEVQKNLYKRSKKAQIK